MQGNRPLFAAEFQCGSREYHVVTNPREMELFYKASIANGLTGWNFYMFSQGRNQRHRGYSGDTFYWYTPLTPEAERNSAFPLVKRMGRIVKTSESIIVEAKRKAEVCVLFYPPYYATELERPETGASGLLFNASSIRRPAYFDGLLRVLQLLNIDYDMADLANAPAEEFMHYRQVWAFSTDEMNAADQQKLVDYVNAGGNLVIYPYLPDREMSQKPCTLLRDSISPNRDSISPIRDSISVDRDSISVDRDSISPNRDSISVDRDSISVTPSRTETIDSPLIDLFYLRDIKCANPQVIYDEAMLGGAEVIARTIKGSACGFSKQVGKGTVIHLGTWLGFDTEGHKPAYEALLARSGATLQQATVSHENLAVRERFTSDGSGLLFIANYYNEEFSGSVKYKHPGTGDSISIPYDGSTIVWPALYGVLSPLCLKLAEGISILHCTSDILDISVQDHCIKIALFGDRDLRGEIVFEGPETRRISGIHIESGKADMQFSAGRLWVSYNHKHHQELTLTINLDH